MLIGYFNVVSELQSELEGLKLRQERNWFSFFFPAECRNIFGIWFVIAFPFHHTILAKHFIVNKVISHT